jgi:hypothetical protein
VELFDEPHFMHCLSLVINTKVSADAGYAALRRMSILYNALLTFVAANRDTASTAHIRRIILARFTSDQILAAVAQLWGLPAASQFIGEPPKKKNSKVRSADEAYVEDLLDAFQKLDEEGQLPKIAVLSDQIYALSRIRAEDIDVISPAERLLKVENTLQRLAATTSQPAPADEAVVQATDQGGPAEKQEQKEGR